MSNSSLVKYTKISPNSSNPRNHSIDTITIHCVVGQLSAESIGGIFASSAAQASSNYGVDKDGRVGMYVEEKNRSWCSSNSANDNRAITIEVASNTSHPYAINSAAYNSLITLVTDICKRNAIKSLKWKGDPSLIGQVDKQNMTVHRWFANKACPGDYLYNLHGQIANEVNNRLGTGPTPTPSTPFTVRVTASSLNIRSGPGTQYSITGAITDKGVYTIVEVSNGWGKLKSGAGWISLDYTTRV